MKYLKLFETEANAIYDNSEEKLYDAPGIGYVVESDRVVLADYELGDKYYIDSNLEPQLYIEEYPVN